MFERSRIVLLAAVSSALLMAAGCTMRQPSQPLYADLGGQPGIAAVVENLMYRIADDAHIVGFFANTNIDHFVASLEQQLCDISDGPCQYQGPPMDRAHQHMGLDDSHFNRLVEHLDAAMIDENIPLQTRNRLYARLAPLHADIMRLQ
ncbi:group 1 truncated hemoglobin [Franzmannia qiaohouensis]|uniref:Group 1 truncated hemoglobin n=1 Tax=Franzmannia qiaohouensis TaxID=1329370 RepID=A0ABU1HH75_9GAMM|nr:group 1 truncated hemoglobin [Halomonas qiaohouensis]MDR5906656.1 group 1 truncated hemoglobin [Halomonas qiaohouensis]